MSTIPTATERETLLERICADMPPMPNAACKADPYLFFVTDAQREEIAAAKRLCATCVELKVCRPWALANPDLTPWGIWGGLTATERGGGTDARICETCMKLYRPKKHNQRYCTRACYRDAKAAKQPEYDKRRRR